MRWAGQICSTPVDKNQLDLLMYECTKKVNVRHTLYYWFILLCFIFSKTGEVESSTSGSQHAQHKRAQDDRGQIDFYPLSVAYTGSIGTTKIQAILNREQIKDSGIDTCLSSSCQTLSEEVLKAQVYNSLDTSTLNLTF